MKNIVVSLILISLCLSQAYSSTSADNNMAAYLMVYFKDETHSLYMAVSDDGYSFVDVNDGKPIIAGDTISFQKGVRDPHIFRGPDNCFYLSMTDLHIYAKKEGLRETEWERDGNIFGWGNNRGLVLMKSHDLLNWTRTNIQIEELFPDMKDIGCVWAPQTTYDDKAGKLMLYFTMRYKNEPCKVYYSYVNEEYTTLTSKPELIFDYPTAHSYIDADITKVGDDYHMFYAASDGTPGIKQAVSAHINKGYTYNPQWIDPEPRSCEAPNVWKRIGEKKWVLMYDVYGVVPHNLGFSETTDFKTFTNIGRFNEGRMKAVNFLSPKHASVIQITRDEYDRLEQKWHFSAYRNLDDEKRVNLDFDRLRIADTFRKNLHWDIPLDTIGTYGSKIAWTSDNHEFLTDDGKLLKQSSRNGKKQVVKMTATISSGKVSKSRSFDVNIAYCQPEYGGYLFAYFEGDGEPLMQEHLRFGVSEDGFNWKALNDNNPIVSSDTISQTKGIRDPHILRCEDGKTFYLVATDMSAVRNGWKSSNPGIVMMKSENLTDWSHHTLDLAKTYPNEFSNAQWVWAPQTIFDPVENRYLVYFTVIFHDDPHLDFYCAYANRDFTGFENTPILMHRTKYGAIDADIVYHDGLYHLFYKGNIKNKERKEIKSGIQKATAKTLQGPWHDYPDFLDAYAGTRTGVEGSGIFKLNDSETFILMYDLFRSKKYEFQRSNNLTDFSSSPESFTKDFTPRHGTVINLTSEEMERLCTKWQSASKRQSNNKRAE